MRGALLLSIALLGCASGPLPASFAPHLDWPVAADLARAGGPRLGIAPLDDARSTAARAGARPPLEFSWFGIEREGFERTGDDAFDVPVLEAVGADLLATLERSGTFASVERVSFDPRDPAAWPSDSGPDFALRGELEQFTGSQWHSFVVTPFRVGFVRDRWGTPRGRVALHFELWSRSGRVWSGRVATLEESARGGLADAVLEALSRNHEALADLLDEQLRPRTRPIRLLELRVLDACALGSDAVQRVVSQTSRVFAREADVALIAWPEPWSVPKSARGLDALLAAVAQLEPPTGGVVIALAPAEQVPSLLSATERTGLATPLGRHAVALCPAEGEASVLTLAHELAHLFGAVHVREPASIMNATADFDARFFDPLNRRILRELRERDFARPLDAAAVARLSAIYRAAERHPERVDPAAIDSALRALQY